MRALSITTFLLLGLGSVSIYASAAELPFWNGNPLAPAREALEPQREAAPPAPGLLCVLGVLTASLPALGKGRHAVRVKPTPSTGTWGRALEIAFLLDVILVGGLLAFLWVLSTSTISADDAFQVQTVGSLFAALLLEAALGSLMAVMLLFVEKTRALYCSTLTLHVAEVAILVLIYVTGTNASIQLPWN
jgi:hypothetical protein